MSLTIADSEIVLLDFVNFALQGDRIAPILAATTLEQNNVAPMSYFQPSLHT